MNSLQLVLVFVLTNQNILSIQSLNFSYFISNNKLVYILNSLAIFSFTFTCDFITVWLFQWWNSCTILPKIRLCTINPSMKPPWNHQQCYHSCNQFIYTLIPNSSIILASHVCSYQSKHIFILYHASNIPFCNPLEF